MKVFISWSGKRAHQVALALEQLFKAMSSDINIFVSSHMEKGIHWFSQIVRELQKANIGIICLTPESLNSNWLHFEAGALANHLLLKEGKEEDNVPEKLAETRLYTFLHQVKPAQLSGPLSAYQSTSSTKDDTLQLLKSIMGSCDIKERDNDEKWNNNFDHAWKVFEKSIEDVQLSISELIPEFESLFHRKTFNEPLQQCRAQKWTDRYHGALETYFKLVTYNQLVRAACQYQIDLFDILQLQVDAYVMSLELLLKQEAFPLNDEGIVDIKPAGIVKACESCRLTIKDTVSRILDPLNVPRTDDAVRFTKCETFEQKKLLVHRKEFKLRRHLEEKNGRKGIGALEGLLDPKTLGDYLSSPWELDRIYYYLIKENINEPSEQEMRLALGAVQLEMEKVLSVTDNASLMPLSYSLGALEAAIVLQASENLVNNISETLKNQIEKYIMEDPKNRDAGQHIRRSIIRILTRLNDNVHNGKTSNGDTKMVGEEVLVEV